MKDQNGFKGLVFEVDVFPHNKIAFWGKTRIVTKELHLPVGDAAGTFINGVLCSYPGDPATALSMTALVIFWKN